MNWRMKLADRISGGKLVEMIAIAHEYRKAHVAICGERNRAWAGLGAIVRMETPSANATVCRMAKTAREALK